MTAIFPVVQGVIAYGMLILQEITPVLKRGLARRDYHTSAKPFTLRGIPLCTKKQNADSSVSIGPSLTVEIPTLHSYLTIRYKHPEYHHIEASMKSAPISSKVRQTTYPC